jgi:aryl-alcohol dehydrogenase-like predicted oxidoreductase
MRYKVFGRHTGLRVSELVLGAGTFGTRWGHGPKPDEADPNTIIARPIAMFRQTTP